MTPSSGDDPREVLSDPRIGPDNLRAYHADGDPLVLVGAVHDHPASAFRARRAVTTLAPDVVGVELPGLALPLFERRAMEGASGGPGGVGDRCRDAEPGGEFGAALAAAAEIDARRAGIDALGPSFARSLLRELRDRDASLGTARRVLAAVRNVASHAVSCRLAASLGERWPRDPGRDARFDHDVSPGAEPERLAEHEARQLSRSRSVLRALERPMADDVVDAARERTMAANLDGLRSAGGTVAVVGFDHFEGIEAHLLDRGFERHPVETDALDRRWG